MYYGQVIVKKFNSPARESQPIKHLEVLQTLFYLNYSAAS